MCTAGLGHCETQIHFDFQVKTLIILPNMLTSLTKMSPEDILSTGADFTEMVLVTGSTHFSAANTRAVLANTNVKSLIQAYGATELGGIVAVDDTENTIAGSVGLVGPNTGLEVCVNKETTINHLLVVRNCK